KWVYISDDDRVDLNRVGLNRVGLNRVGLNRVGPNRVGTVRSDFRASLSSQKSGNWLILAP
ncbi:MAG TPA: hypothetical protein QF533_12210, partial [Nitrospinota bacterium]|nr:hypothetical protein [Nitrospinota bacterium]